MTEERRNRILSVIEKRQFDLGIVLENVNDPHNISAVMRSCDAVGVQDVYVLHTETPRMKKKWGKKSSSSASQWLNVMTFDNAEECFGELRKKYQKIYATHLHETSQSLYDMDFTQSMALVFGNEHAGISSDTQKRVDGNFIIPQVGIVKSLNISVACAVTLYEAFRQKEKQGHYDSSTRFLQEQQLLKQQWKVE